MGNAYFYPDDSIGIIGGGEAAVAGVLGVFFLVYGLIVLFALAFSVATYVLHSLGLYTIAQRRRIRKPWLAWIPVGNIWLLGSISDQYQYLAKGKVKSRRKIMLGLNVAAVVMYFIWLYAALVSVLLEDINGLATAGSVLIMLVGLLIFLGLVVALAVYEYMCYYDLYRSCERNNGVLYLILTIVFSVIMPFLVFACRNKDDGMPVRKQSEPVTKESVEVVVEEKETEGVSDNG